ncbi:hypothetical protein [Mucilaginibacter arboris]|uniref:Uncharacterized protein n=1 Tax=Mucilaginibacter arboris TaxID=2682090 RepID=A0A7K1SUM1_9SPHI|nr:hypothetical protein [Mucilaginibacter arboris]MVN20750.1 hypothetical protein [Mucilaginibacter arboris]
MYKDEVLLQRAKKLIEAKLGWGGSKNWVNQDFIALSKRINEETGSSVSHITLKRIWGKVNYDGLPQTYTLNTLVKFIGYDSWRDFIVKNDESMVSAELQTEAEPGPVINGRVNKRASLILMFIVVGLSFATFKLVRHKTPNPVEYTFSSHTTLNAGIPNSVIFDYDATKAPDDSVIIQQSWDTRLQRKVSKNDHQTTLIYYFPGFFKPKLIVSSNIVKEQDLLLKSDGWVAALLDKDVPIYFKKNDVMRDGKMSLPIEKIKSQHIGLAPKPPVLSFCNVQDFGELYSDDFEFETSLKNDYRSESSVCQMTNIYLLCKGTAINIPLCSKGCESALNFFFTTYEVSGKKRDLSAFGVDFNSFTKVRVQSKAGKAKVFLNDKLAFVVDHGITKSKIIGIDIAFQGTGSVDYVKLRNEKVSFEDGF